MADEIKPPARVLALAKLIGDTPVAWKEREDGSVVIVFCNKGKQTFEKNAEKVLTAEAETPPTQPTDAETLAPSKSKKKGDT